MIPGQWSARGGGVISWPLSYGPPFSSANKTDRHDITEILLKVALHAIKQTNSKCMSSECTFGSFKLFLETMCFQCFSEIFC